MNGIDKSNLYAIIRESIKQLSADLRIGNQDSLRRRSFSNIIFCGMGGSALASDFFSFFKNHQYSPLFIDLPIIVHRSYDLPAETNADSLIICVSYSGQTEETISSYQKAIANNLEVAGVTCGGQLAKLLEKDQRPWVEITQSNIPPRLSLGYQLVALVKLFIAYGLLERMAEKELVRLTESVDPTKLEEVGKNASQLLINKIPIIYSSDKNRAIARTWKINLNESSKVLAFYNSLPELNHNEMIGWTENQGLFTFIFLNDQADHQQIQKRMRLTADTLQNNGFAVQNIQISGNNPLEKLFRSLIIGDWCSYHLAIARGIDPASIELIEDFKKKLSSL